MNDIAHNPVLWITLANVLYLVSYSVHDILWLRVLSVAGSILLVPYYLLQPVPQHEAIAWNFVFVAINAGWIAALIVQRRPIHFDADESRLRELSFPTLAPRDLRDLYAMGVWDDIVTGASLVVHDNAKGRFSVILRGTADVVLRGNKIDEIGEGQFVGDLDRHAEALDLDVIVRSPTRVMCWAGGSLHRFLLHHPDVELALRRSIGFELRNLLATVPLPSS